MRKIVVVTPVRNEAWILERFLRVTSEFADHIVVADQFSTDGSPELCRRFPKVTLIDNPNREYNERDRQCLLLRSARELIPGDKIILALDADEVLAANAMPTPGWAAMLNAPRGTVLCFEKPDLFGTTEQCIRYTTPWPVGYVDDGCEHRAVPIHSLRIPVRDQAPRLNLGDVKILHYSMTRLAAQAAKMRMYSVIENALGTLPSVLLRRWYYSAKKDFVAAGRLAPVPAEWLAGWEARGIDMRAIPQQKYYWQDFEVLRYFDRHGSRKFWRDDIWDFDWESCRRFARARGVGEIPAHPIQPPPHPVMVGWACLSTVYGQLKRWKYHVTGA